MQEGTESGEEEKSIPKSQHKQDCKIKAQSSQIKDLREKLDGAIAEILRLKSGLTLTHSRRHSLMHFRHLGNSAQW